MALAPNRIHQGDCVQLLGKLDDESVDLVFADPPFNIGYEYDVYDDAQESAEYVAWCREWIDGVYRALKPNGTFWLAIGDEFAAELKIEAQKSGFHCRSWVIWYYTFGVNCRNGFSRSHTHLFHFVKNKAEFTFNRLNPQIRVKSARQLVYADKRSNPDGRLPDNTWITRPQDAPLSFSPNHDTWYFARVAGTFKEREGFHGCQMPEQLLARIIRSSSRPQDLVLDPFGGSGTTLSVSKKLARNWMGFELSKDYVKYIKQRMQKTKVGDPLDGPEDPIESAPSTANGKRRKKSKDKETEKAVVESFKKTSRGYPVDYMLCHQEWNEEFIDKCKQQGIEGHPFYWNRLLLQLRKASKLPRSTKRPPKLTSKEMDQVGFASEVAWRLLAIDYQRTLDDILCSPDYAAEFDRLAFLFGPNDPAMTSLNYRRAAVSIRKRSNKARESATEKFGKWIDRNRNLKQVTVGDSLEELDSPGVFILNTEEIGFFAGESENMKERVHQMLDNDRWNSLRPQTINYIPLNENLSSRFALKSALAIRENPILNCRLLVHDSELPNKPR